MIAKIELEVDISELAENTGYKIIDLIRELKCLIPSAISDADIGSVDKINIKIK